MKAMGTGKYTGTALAVLLILLAGKPIGAQAAEIDALTSKCANCHGRDGVSADSRMPTIAGASALYFTDNMALYKEGARPCPEAEYLDGPDKGTRTDMCKVAEGLSDSEIEALASHYAGKAFVRARQSFDAEKAAQGQKLHKAHCEKCHEDGGSSAEDDAGILAGQWMPYLEKSFEFYASGEREMPKKMKPKFEKLDTDEREALLHFYASQQ